MIQGRSVPTADEQQAELLDRYSYELVRGSDPLDPGLDPGFAAFVRGVHTMGTAASPHAGFDVALQAELQAFAAEHRSRLKVGSRGEWWWGAARRRLVGLAAASLAVVAVAGILVVSGQDAALSAADVLERAQASASAPTSQGVTSFEMTVTDWHLPRSADGTVHLAGTPITSSVHIWFEAPDRRRIEADGGRGVWDGTSYWLLVDQWDEYFVWPQEHVIGSNWLAPGGTVGLPFRGMAETTLPSAIACDDGRMIGDDSVAGRPAHMVELDPADCPAGDPEVGRRQIWVDKDTGFVLRSDGYAATDDALLVSSIQATSVEYNLTIPATHFVLAPPSDAKLQVDPSAVGAHVSELGSLAEAEAVATFGVNPPASLPADYVLDRVRHAWPAYMTTASGQLVGGSLAADWLEIRYEGPDEAWLEFGEGYSRRYYSWFAVSPPEDRGRLLIDGREAYWVRGTPPPDVVDRRSSDAEVIALFWYEEQGRFEHRYVALASNELSVDELVELAKSRG